MPCWRKAFWNHILSAREKTDCQSYYKCYIIAVRLSDKGISMASLTHINNAMSRIILFRLSRYILIVRGTVQARKHALGPELMKLPPKYKPCWLPVLIFRIQSLSELGDRNEKQPDIYYLCSASHIIVRIDYLHLILAYRRISPGWNPQSGPALPKNRFRFYHQCQQ